MTSSSRDWHDPSGIISRLGRAVPSCTTGGVSIDKDVAAWNVDVPFEDARRARAFLDTCEVTVLEETRSIARVTAGRLQLQLATITPERETWRAYASALIDLDADIAATGELRLSDRTKCSQRGLVDAAVSLSWNELAWLVATHTGPVVRGDRFGQGVDASDAADVLATLISDRMQARRYVDTDVTGAIADYLRREPDLIDIAKALAANERTTTIARGKRPVAAPGKGR